MNPAIFRSAATASLLAGLLGLAAPASAGPVISPYADDLKASSYSADSSYPGSSAQSIFNGGSWNGGSKGEHWVQADMEKIETLSRVVLTIDVTPNNNTWQKVYLSDTYIGANWGQLTPVAIRSGFTTNGQQFTLDFAPTSGRYLQVVSFGGESWTALGDGKARSNWVDPTAQNKIPEPASLALVLAALGAAGAMRRFPARRA